MTNQTQILRIPAVAAMVGMSKSTVRRMVLLGDFPAPLRIGYGPRGAIGWQVSTVEAWVAARVAAAGGAR